MAHNHRILSREAGLIVACRALIGNAPRSVEVGLVVNGYLGDGWWAHEGFAFYKAVFNRSNMALAHIIDLRRWRLPVLQIDQRHSRRAAVEDKKFALCQRECRWTV